MNGSGVASGDVAVRARGLTVRRGARLALDGVDLDVARGAVLGLLGPNGAGKTTLLAVLAALVRPSDGRVEVAGHDPARRPREVRRRVGYAPGEPAFYDDARVGEYLEFFAAASGVARRAWPGLVGGLLELVDLGTARDAAVGSLSRGAKQRLNLARAMVHDPEVLLLDEPAGGLDPDARAELRGLLASLAELAKTVVVASHLPSELDGVTHAAVLSAGRLLAAGPLDEVRRRLGAERTVVVRLAGGEERRFRVPDEEAQADLLAELVADQHLAVVGFAEEGAGLEGLYRTATPDRTATGGTSR